MASLSPPPPWALGTNQSSGLLDSANYGDGETAEQRLVPISQCLRGGGSIEASLAPPSISSNVSLDLLVLILSSQQQRLGPSKRRQAVRRSWAFAASEMDPSLGAPGASPSDLCSVRHLFVVGGGKSAARLGSSEQPSERDVLVLPVPDGYRQITAKVLAALKWVASHVSFKYLLKTDDDSFVCASRMLELLRTLPRRLLYLGVVNPAHKVITSGKKYGRWRDPVYVELFNRSVYAPYMQGAGYVLSADMVAMVVRRAEALPKLPAVEDALVGTLIEGEAQPTCAHLPPLHLPNSPPPSSLTRACAPAAAPGRQASGTRTATTTP